MRKRLYMVLLMFLFAFQLTGCRLFDDIINNEIYNKSYNVNIDINDIEDGFSYAVEKASESIVGISLYEKVGLSLLSEYQEKTTGSGVVYSCKANMKNGTIKECAATINDNNVKNYSYNVLTNYHVIASSSLNRKISVFLGEKNLMIDTNLLGYNKKNDLAVLNFRSPLYITPIDLADSDSIKSGNFVISIGNPNGHEFYNSATLGIVSYPKRYMQIDTDSDDIPDYETEFIQHDSAINPGNSGGALINIKGELIGINRLKLQNEEIDNMGFAIPSNLINSLLPYLENGITYNRVKLGITVYEVEKLKNNEYYTEYNLPSINMPDNINNGLYVYSIEKNSTYSKEITVGDIILSVNNVNIYRIGQFSSMLDEYNGKELELKIYRSGKEVIVKINI